MDINLYGTECATITKEEGLKLTEAFAQVAREKAFYQFSVSAVSQIDLNRIVREQYESGHLVTLLTDGKDIKGLLLHNEFLTRFSIEDGVYLAGYKLCSNAGYNHLSVHYANGSYRIRESLSNVPLESARLFHVAEEELKRLPAELAAARAFTRKITVKVHTL